MLASISARSPSIKLSLKTQLKSRPKATKSTAKSKPINQHTHTHTLTLKYFWKHMFRLKNNWSCQRPFHRYKLYGVKRRRCEPDRAGSWNMFHGCSGYSDCASVESKDANALKKKNKQKQTRKKGAKETDVEQTQRDTSCVEGQAAQAH